MAPGGRRAVPAVAVLAVVVPVAPVVVVMAVRVAQSEQQPADVEVRAASVSPRPIQG